MKTQLTTALGLLLVLPLLAPAGCSDNPGTFGTEPGTAVADATVTDPTTTPDASATDAPSTVDTPSVPVDAVNSPEEPEAEPGLIILSLDPQRGLASGLEQVEIEGAGFVRGVQVLFGESAAEDVFVLDEHRIAVITPPRTPGLVDVTIRDPETGASATLEDGFLFYNPVSIVSIEPANGHVLGGEPITIRGSGFVPGSQVILGDRAAISIEVIDTTTILAVTPEAGGIGPVNVHVSNDLGIGTLQKGYLYFDSPVVKAVSPPVGLVAGGTLVQLSGEGFFEPLAVTFGGRALENVVVTNASTITGRTPLADVAGAVDVLVSTTFGAALLEDAFVYLDDLEPGTTVDILGVTPGSGSASGLNLVTVVAKGLTDSDDTVVMFGGKAAVVKSVDAVAHSAVVEVPAGEIGRVDVTLTNSNGSDTAVEAYRYEAFIEVYEVLPGFGPVQGGTPITISGTGFDSTAQVRVGALPAAAVKVVDSQTITASTPPGTPGLANITVLQGGLTDTLVGGFVYTAPMDLWVVDPGQGSVAGGTLVKLLGSGFPSDSKVSFGGIPATHVKVVSPSVIEAKTPGGDTGSVDVRVDSDLTGTRLLPNGFTYYDPESSYGGTWGNQVDGDINVTVLSTADGTGIPDAFVMLWTDPTTPYQGFTNAFGQITFSGTDLSGEQMVSASKEGFANASVVEYDATNVTLYMSPTTPPSPGAPPEGPPPPIWKAQIRNVNKYVPIPWGKCTDKHGTPGKLCSPCTTDDQCGGMRCSDIPQNGKFCTSTCTDTADCPSGFMCYPLPGVEQAQCVPSAGRITAFCDWTEWSIFARDTLPAPGIEVNADFSIEMPVPAGEYAIFCWGGIWNDDDDFNPFTPYVLGVRRGFSALPGETYEEELALSHPLNGSLEARLDIPPNGLGGPDYNILISWLDLGSDGVIEFLDMAQDPFGGPDLTIERVPKKLTGELFDATYGLYGGAFTPDFELGQLVLPASLLLREGIERLKDDTVFYGDPLGWTGESTGITQDINGLFAMSEGDVFGVGTDGLILRSIGGSWATAESGTTEHLQAIHGLPTGEVIAVGGGGVAVHFDGNTWSATDTGAPGEVRGVWMAAPDNAVAVGWYAVYHWDGATWTAGQGDTGKNLRDVWGFGPDDIWAVGNYGQVIHFDGTEWATVATQTTQNLRAIWGSSPTDIFIVGEAGLLLHYDGVELVPMVPPPNFDKSITLYDLHGTPGGPVYAVGAKGTILAYIDGEWRDQSPSSYRASFYAVTGAGSQLVATGSHELLLGPMMTVPESVRPAEGTIMSDSYEISWTARPGIEDPHFSYVEVAIPSLTGPIPEWTIINDWDVTNVLLPDFPDIEGTPGISQGQKILTIFRVYKEGFDIDNYSNLDLNTLSWQAWALHQSGFIKD